MEGDSLRRQTSLAADYANRHGLVLDDELTYHDLGVSAFRGGNANVGKLGEFLEAVSVGQVPKGSFLLVESLDRISRDFAFDAQRLLANMIHEGITVVTLLDERVYSLDGLRQDPMGMMYSIMGFMRANEESAVKSRRLKQAWHNKRATLDTVPLTGIVPAWLRLNPETRRIEQIPERVDVVRRVFELTLAGVGQHKIAETFNREGLPTWGAGKKRGVRWHRSYIAKVLANPAVIGTLIPHRMEHEEGRKRRVPLEPALDYYPAVVSQKTWDEARALLAAKGAPRGRQASAGVSNILARLAECPQCGGSMTRVQKGSRAKSGYPSLVCSAAKSGAGCRYKSIRYSGVEDAILRRLPDIIRERVGLAGVDELEGRIDNLQRAIWGHQDQIEELVDRLSEANSPALMDRLRKLEGELPEWLAELARLLEQRDIRAGAVVGSRIDRALRALEPSEGSELDLAEANLAIRGLFRRAVINWPTGTIDLEWHLGGTCEVPFGAMRETQQASSAD